MGLRMNNFLLKFQVHYKTQFGQQIVVQRITGSEEGITAEILIPLTYTENGIWKGEYELVSADHSISYRYQCVDDMGALLDQESSGRESLDLVAGSTTYLIDTWQAKRHPENALYNSAFTNVLFRPHLFSCENKEKIIEKALTFTIKVPRIAGSNRVCVLGNVPGLGTWSVDHPLLLCNDEFPTWTGVIRLPADTELEYKYGLYDTVKHKVTSIEQGPNRRLSTHGLDGDVRVNDLYFSFEDMYWKGAGISIPVFSLRTEKSFGVGEFIDLIPLVNWAIEIGFRLIQTLPINDTSATGTALDSLPYSAISVYALHPLYLNVELLDGFDETVDRRLYEARKKELNALAKYDYLSVLEAKLSYARAAFESEKHILFSSDDFAIFFEVNEEWLRPYALFCVLRDTYETPTFTQWGSDAIFDREKMLKMTSSSSDIYEHVLFYYYLQYYLDKQLFEVSEYARDRGLALKGDIPIGIYRDSVDAWTHPHLFDMGSQAGAPPDPFSKLGQNWGFPTYRWDVMKQDGYAWWQNRLRYLARYFDVFRIDHILGFFRIWQIPYSQMQGLIGYFNPAIPITLKELDELEISFDRSRYCKPYVTTELLVEVFGDEFKDVCKTFFKKAQGGLFAFKKAFDTQRKIYEHFRKDGNKERLSLQSGLFSVMNEVLFIEDLTDANCFHPRIDFQNTNSFRSLSNEVKEKMEMLYFDYFYLRQEAFWAQQAREKLPALKSATDMQICGEDLGMIPACVPPVMREFALLSLEIQRMSKNPKTAFLHVDDIPYLSVCSTSTHDMAPIRAWWEEMESDTRQAFYAHELHLEGSAPDECTEELAKIIVQMHFAWPSMWAVIPIQDLLAMSANLRVDDPSMERINVPSASTGNWQYRLHLNIESLVEAQTFNQDLKEMLRKTSRLMT